MRALIAFDKFKDALTARQACETTAAALRQIHPDWQFDLCPLADGGDGFLDVLTGAAGGHKASCAVTGPRGGIVEAAIGLVPAAKIPKEALALLELTPGPAGEDTAFLGNSSAAGATIAVIEMAAASGLALLPPEMRDPWQATSYGTGQLIRAAAERGVSAVLLGVGGSATNDLGLGALAALGLEFRTAHGSQLHLPIPARWGELEAVAGAISPSLPPIRIACDVDNPLLGPRGATATYGPQKGLAPADFLRMEAAMARAGAQLLGHHVEALRLALRNDTHPPTDSSGWDELGPETPGAGAAGGISFGLMVAAGARLVPGFALVSAWLDIERRLAKADVVITGEGSFDESSSNGKGPGALIDLARRLGKPAHVFAGRTSGTPPKNVNLQAITPADMPLREALPKTAANLARCIRSSFL